MMANPHLLSVSSLNEARSELVFEPITPKYTAGELLR